MVARFNEPLQTDLDLILGPLGPLVSSLTTSATSTAKEGWKFFHRNKQIKKAAFATKATVVVIVVAAVFVATGVAVVVVVVAAAEDEDGDEDRQPSRVGATTDKFSRSTEILPIFWGSGKNTFLTGQASVINVTRCEDWHLIKETSRQWLWLLLSSKGWSQNKAKDKSNKKSFFDLTCKS